MKKRIAFANVKNNTSQPILAVGMVHKFSGKYKNRREWGIIKPGESGDAPMRVEYSSGFGSVGFDWWVVTWYSADMKTMHYSDPKNFQSVVNWFEGIAPNAVAAAAGAVVGLSTSFTGPGAVIAATAAAIAAQATTDQLISSEDTVGFKQHNLRSKDEGELTEIIINEDLTVTISSKSGTTNTRSSSRPASHE